MNEETEDIDLDQLMNKTNNSSNTAFDMSNIDENNDSIYTSNQHEERIENNNEGKVFFNL